MVSKKEPPPSPAPAARPPRRRRWKWLVVFASGLILASIGAAPWLVVRLVLPSLAARSGEFVRGSLSYESASFGWTTPLSLTAIVGKDLDGHTLLEIPELRTDLSLFRLIRSRTALGTIALEGPKVRLVTDGKTSNLEEFLAPLSGGPRSKEPLSLAWTVRGGQVEILESMSNRPLGSLSFERLGGSLERAEQVQLTLDLVAHIRVGPRSGRLELVLNTSETDGGNRTGDLAATLTDVPLEILQPLWPRMAAPITLVGLCNGRIEGKFQPGNQGDVTWRDFRATQLSIHAADLFGDDAIACEQIQSSGNARWNREQWHAALDAQSDYGTANLRADSIAAGRATVGDRAFGGGDVDFDADLDLARLARSLPRTLRLRDQVQLESGRAIVHVDSEAEATGTRWNATLKSSDFVALHNGERITWSNPIDAQLVARWNNQHWQVDELRCQSEFLNARLEGTADAATVRLDADLAKLAARLSDFFEVPAEFRGQIDGHLDWKRHPPEVVADGVLNVNNFACNLPGQPAWSEPAMVCSIHANLRQDVGGRWSELREMRGELLAQPDRLLATLVQPISLITPVENVAVNVEWQGQLASWQQRLGPFLPGGDVTLAGAIDLKSQSRIGRDSLRIETLNGELRDLVARGPSLDIHEPRITLTLEASVDLRNKTMESKHAELVSSVVSVRADDLFLSWAAVPETTTSLGGARSAPRSSSGTVQFRSDLSRLRGWLPQSATTEGGLAITGEVIGRAAFAMPIEIEAEIRDFQIAERARHDPSLTSPSAGSPTVLWDDPRIHILARGGWKPASVPTSGEPATNETTSREGSSGEATLDLFEVTATGLKLTASGVVSDLSTAPRLRLDGSLEYDWKTHSERLRRLLGPSFMIEGKRSDPIHVNGLLASAPGTLIPPNLQGETGVGWDAISYYGIDVGKGQTNAVLRDAVAHVSALDIPVSGGILKAEPRIDFHGDVPLLTNPPGVLLDQVRITPEMCRNWLKFIAPLVANATRAEGTFTMQVDRLHVPLGHPDQASIAGALVIQEAVIGPGPLAQAIIALVDRLTAVAERRVPRLAALSGDTWLKMPSQVVAFEMQDGRVLHRELRMQIKDLTVITRGWVAVDQSMELSVEVPVPDKWVDNNRLLEGLRGKTITVPIRGTLDKPVLDEKILNDLTKGLLGTAAEKLLQDQLRRRLDKLFRP